MNMPSALAVLLVPALALSAAAQDAPRLDGSNVPQPVVSLAPAQTTQATQTPSPSHQLAPGSTQPSRGKGKTSPAAPVVLVPPPPPTPADMPPVPASVYFSNGLLTIHARNASLSQILHDASSQTGMQMEGTPEEQRIFGDFGPAPVPVVIGQLLDGGPSNYVLFGKNANLAPRSLVITPKSSLAPGQVAGVNKPPVTVNNEDDEDDDAPPIMNPQANVHPLLPNRTVPMNGAPMNNDQPAPGSPSVRTPQQILDDMQRNRQNQPQPQPDTQ